MEDSFDTESRTAPGDYLSWRRRYLLSHALELFHGLWVPHVDLVYNISLAN